MGKLAVEGAPKVGAAPEMAATGGVVDEWVTVVEDGAPKGLEVAAEPNARLAGAPGAREPAALVELLPKGKFKG